MAPPEILQWIETATRRYDVGPLGMKGNFYAGSPAAWEFRWAICWTTADYYEFWVVLSAGRRESQSQRRRWRRQKLDHSGRDWMLRTWDDEGWADFDLRNDLFDNSEAFLAAAYRLAPRGLFHSS